MSNVVTIRNIIININIINIASMITTIIITIHPIPSSQAPILSKEKKPYNETNITYPAICKSRFTTAAFMINFVSSQSYEK